MLNLLSLPYDVLTNIVSSISFDDYYNLGCSCKQLSFLLREDRICKLALQVSLPAKFQSCAHRVSSNVIVESLS
jgi:hypothetical protein